MQKTTTNKAPKKKRTIKEFPDMHIPLGQFDQTKLILQAPRKVGTQDAIKSRMLYKTGEDETGNSILCTPYVTLEGQSCYVSTVHPLEDKGKQDTNTNLSSNSNASVKDLIGYQITYSITSWTTREKPTANELESKKVLDGVTAAIKEQAPRFSNIKYPGTNELVFGSKTMRDSLKELDDTRLKPIYSYPSMKDASGKKVFEDIKGPDGEMVSIQKLDTSKNQSAYFKMMTYGKNEELAIYSHLYDSEYDPSQDPEGKGGEFNIAELAGKKGFIDQPTFKLADVYFGMNPKTDFIAFPQIKFAAGIYEEEERSSVPNFREQMFSKRNTDSSVSEAPPTKGGQLSKLFNTSSNGEEGVASYEENEVPASNGDVSTEDDPVLAEFNKKKAEALAARKTLAPKRAPAKKN